MTNTRKITILLTWLFIIIYLIVSPIMIKDKADRIICDTVEINLDDEGKSFITENDVLAILEKEEIKIIGQSIDDIPEVLIEYKLSKQPLIKRADVYALVSGNINIDIEQNTPIMRVINNKNKNFYINEDGSIMPISVNYTAHVLVVTGNVPKPVKNENNQAEKSEIIEGLYDVAKFIVNNELWNAQIEQIHVTSKNELELFPRVGNHKIIFGSTKDCENKFNKLEALYQQGLSKVGWNKYKTINLKFKNKVVCTKL